MYQVMLWMSMKIQTLVLLSMQQLLRQRRMQQWYWNDMGHPDYKVNVNLSVVQLLQNDIVKKIKGIIDEVGIEPGNLWPVQ